MVAGLFADRLQREDATHDAAGFSDRALGDSLFANPEVDVVNVAFEFYPVKSAVSIPLPNRQLILSGVADF